MSSKETSEGLRRRAVGGQGTEKPADETDVLPKPGSTVKSAGSGSGALVGVTPSGLRFALPALRPPFQYHGIANWNVLDWIKYASALNLGLLFTGAPLWFYIIWFLCWRLAYNAGLGYLLHVQSHRRSLTRRFSESRSMPMWKKFFRIEMGESYDFTAVPDEFNAWIVFRRVVDIILANDLLSYVAFALKCYQPGDWSLYTVGRHLLGAVICGAAVWGKTDAYRVVGTFAWYWGDFFFLVDQRLTFDRVFAIAPHPMYTLGYGFFYGAAIICQSYPVFLVSLTAHVLQLIFLELVENPHIEKTYTDVKAEQAEKEKKMRLSEKTAPFFKKDLMGIMHFTPFRSSDLTLLSMILLHLTLLAFRLPVGVYLTMALFWRVLHSLGCGLILYHQSKSNFWTRKSTEEGMSKIEAFENWKRIYNLSLSTYYTALVTASIASFSYDSAYLALIQLTVGAVLISLNVWSSLSVFDVLGEFGWFYGDFFLTDVPWELKYDGIYRFLNNPESTLGFAAHYGLALGSNSLAILGLSIFSHLSALLFVRWVEEPHLQGKYGKERRQEAGAEQAVRSIVSTTLEELKEKEELMNLVRTASNNFERAKENFHTLFSGSPSSPNARDGNRRNRTDSMGRRAKSETNLKGMEK